MLHGSSSLIYIFFLSLNQRYRIIYFFLSRKKRSHQSHSHGFKIRMEVFEVLLLKQSHKEEKHEESDP